MCFTAPHSPISTHLVARRDQELDLRLGELALADEATTRGNLVPEGLADLADPERHLATVLLQAVLEVEEDALGSLRAQKATLITSRPDWYRVPG